VEPRTAIDSGAWVSLNRKIKYAVQNRGNGEIYLTLKYSSYTFLDKSAEAISMARGQFRQVAMDLARQRGRKPVIDDQMYYESTGYNGITGISETLVANTVRFQ
jgi:hypothetical protein